MTTGDHELVVMNTFLGQYRNPRVRFFRRNILNKVMQDIHTGRVHKVQAGVVGQADTYAIVKAKKPVYGINGKIQGWTKDYGYGRLIEIEFKGPKTIISEAQNNWRRTCEEFGIPYMVLRGEEDETTAETVARYIREFDDFVLEVAG